MDPGYHPVRNDIQRRLTLTQYQPSFPVFCKWILPINPKFSPAYTVNVLFLYETKAQNNSIKFIDNQGQIKCHSKSCIIIRCWIIEKFEVLSFLDMKKRLKWVCLKNLDPPSMYNFLNSWISYNSLRNYYYQ